MPVPDDRTITVVDPSSILTEPKDLLNFEIRCLYDERRRLMGGLVSGKTKGKAHSRERSYSIMVQAVTNLNRELDALLVDYFQKGYVTARNLVVEKMNQTKCYYEKRDSFHRHHFIDPLYKFNIDSFFSYALAWARLGVPNLANAGFLPSEKVKFDFLAALSGSGVEISKSAFNELVEDEFALSLVHIKYNPEVIKRDFLFDKSVKPRLDYNYYKCENCKVYWHAPQKLCCEMCRSDLDVIELKEK